MDKFKFIQLGLLIWLDLDRILHFPVVLRLIKQTRNINHEIYQAIKREKESSGGKPAEQVYT